MRIQNRRIFKEIPGLRGERIILYDWDGETPKFCNLVKLAADGSTAWIVQPRHPLEGVYSGVELDDGNLRAYNMAGYSDTIDYDSGVILHRIFVK
ncbi:MAG TPA: hypothetical protein VMC10_00315 [Stellaceae bacterium]|nr:hypothetical protein [Stellaceae bacterium]